MTLTLTAGSRLGPYEIRSPLGAGGMDRVPADGSRAPTALLQPDRAKGRMRVAWLHFLPDGRSFLHVATGTGGTGRSPRRGEWISEIPK